MNATIPMKTGPLTTAEAAAEYNYRLKERLGMMSPDGKPTEEQRVYAQSEAMREVGLLKKALFPNGEVSEPGDRQAGNATGAQSPGSLH